MKVRTAASRTPLTRHSLTWLVVTTITLAAFPSSAASPFKQLYEAVEAGDVRRAEQLLDEGADVNREFQGRSLVSRAIQNGDVAMTRLLLDRGAVVDLAPEPRQSFGMSALHRAVDSNTPEMVRLLLELGADIDRPGGLRLVLGSSQLNPMPPLSYAIFWDHLEMAHLLIEEGADVDAGACNIVRPLIAAISSPRRDLDLVRLLLDEGAEVDPPAPRPLAAAVRAGHIEIARLLLEVGAEVNPPSQPQPLDLARSGGHEEIAELLLRAGAEEGLGSRRKGKKTPLHKAVSKGDLPAVRALLRSGADLTATDRWKRTPLGLAVDEQQVEIVTTLLEAGADPTPALIWAVNYGIEGPSKEVEGLVETLLDAGADPNSYTLPPPLTRADGNTPLQLAAITGSPLAVEPLIAAGAELDAQQERSCRTALHLALYHHNWEIAQLLIEAGADPTLRADRGRTPLHFAVASADRSVVDLLLENGADLDTPDFDGTTPRELARTRGKAFRDLLAES